MQKKDMCLKAIGLNADNLLPIPCLSVIYTTKVVVVVGVVVITVNHHNQPQLQFIHKHLSCANHGGFGLWWGWFHELQSIIGLGESCTQEEIKAIANVVGFGLYCYSGCCDPKIVPTCVINLSVMLSWY